MQDNTRHSLHPAALALAALLAATLAQPVFADASREESIGVGAGAVIGGFAGGPVGIIVGAAIGAKLGDTMHRKDVEIDRLGNRLQASDQELDTLRHAIDDLDTEVGALREASRPELVSLLQAGIDMDLLFRTDEATLLEDTHGRLATLAETLALMPDVRIRLDGFADERGAADYNRDLSLRRVTHVRDALLAAGIAAERISETAHGELAAIDTSPDSLALQRRVSLTLYVDEAETVAATPR